MCDATALVPIPDLLWQNDGIHAWDPTHPEYGLDDEGRKCLRLDACIVPAITALWAAGVVTIGCCCGHGDSFGAITLQRVDDDGAAAAEGGEADA